MITKMNIKRLDFDDSMICSMCDCHVTYMVEWRTAGMGTSEEDQWDYLCVGCAAKQVKKMLLAR